VSVVRSATVRLEADVASYRANMATAGRATNDAMSSADRAVTQHRSALSSLKNVVLGVAGSYAAIKTATFVRESISAAGNLIETQNKVGVIFRNSADEVERFATNSRRNILLTQQQALDAASTFGIFGKSAGLTGSDLADFSTDLTGLASDLSSFNNTTPDQAIQALGAALRGESEPIRSYGVLLDDATLKAEAMELGLLKPVKNMDDIRVAQQRATIAQAAYNDALEEHGRGSVEALRAQASLGSAQNTLQKATEGTIPPLTQQQKVLAAQSAIFKQTQDAQGDAARTSESYSNQVRILSKNWEDFQVQIGTRLLPIATTFIRFLNNEAMPAVRGFGDWVGDLDFSKVSATLGDQDWEQITVGFSDLGRGLADARDELPTLNDFLDVTGTVLRFAADHTDELAQALPFLVTGLVAVKVAQSAANVAAAATPALRVAEILTNRRLVASNLALAQSIQAQTAAVGGAAGQMATASRSVSRFGTAARGAAGLGGLGLLASSAGDASGGISSLATTAGGALTGFAVGGPIGAAIGAGAAGLFELGKAIFSAGDEAEEADPKTADYADSLNQVTGASTRATRALAAQALQEEGLLDLANHVGVSGASLVDAVVGDEGDYDAAIRRIAAVRRGLVTQLAAADEALSAAYLEDPYSDATKAAREHYLAIEEQIAGVDDLSESLGANRGKLAADAEAQRLLAEAVRGTTVDTRDYRRAMADLPREVRTQIEQLGIGVSRRDIIGLQKQYDLTPKSVETLLKVLGLDQAKNDINNFERGSLHDLDTARPTPTADFDRRDADAKINDFERSSLHNLDVARPTPRAGFDDTDARRRVADFLVFTNSQLDRINDERVDITLSANAVNLGAQLAGLAYGGVLDFYARGGLREQHVAQIAPAGSWRVWAEPETGGEAYIPLDPTKRTRSVDIWQETGRRLGILDYREGGIVVPQVRPTGLDAATAEVARIASVVAAGIGQQLSGAINEKLKDVGRWTLPLPPGSYSIGASLGDGRGHAGLDLPAPVGTQIFAPSAGRVVAAVDGTSGYGRYVDIQHANGILTRHAHMLRRAANSGDLVRAGQVTGSVDSTGHSTGHHLHTEVRENGAIRNPLSFYAARGLTFDTGGVLRDGGVAVNRSGRPEAVLDPDETQAFRDLAAAARAFNVSDRSSRDEVAAAVRSLLAGLRDALGRDAPLVARVTHLGDQLVAEARERDRLRETLGEARDATRELVQAQRGYSATVAGNFVNDIFAEGNTLGDALLQGRADANDADRMERALRQARRLGLDGPTFRSVAASGNLQIARGLDTRREVRELEAVFGRQQRQAIQLGRFAGNQVFGDRLRDAARETRQLSREMAQLRREVSRQVGRLEDAVARGAERGSERGTHSGNAERDRAAARHRKARG